MERPCKTSFTTLAHFFIQSTKLLAYFSRDLTAKNGKKRKGKPGASPRPPRFTSMERSSKCLCFIYKTTNQSSKDSVSYQDPDIFEVPPPAPLRLLHRACPLRPDLPS